MSSSSSQHARTEQAQNKDGDTARKISFVQKPEQHHNLEDFGAPSTRRISHQEHNLERMRRISQYSKEVINTGHSHFPSTQEKEKFRRISQFSRTSDGVDGSDRQRKISHYREWGLLKDPIMTGYWRARGAKREHNGWLEAPVLQENTYKLEPDATWNTSKVNAIIKSVLEEHLKGHKYERNKMATSCLVLSDVIKEKVRQLKLDRFKIVTIVLIGEQKSQKMQVSSRCLWNTDHDSFASYEFSHGDVCAVGMVFAVYQD